MNPLSVYWTPHHRRPTDYEYMLALQPAVVKIMDGGPPDYQWVRLNLPGSLVIARDWALSEQKSDMLADPAGTGARHAREWSEKVAHLGFQPDNTLVLGINEPAVWDPGVIPALVSYTVAFLDGCRQHGLRGGALQLSVGWPANTGAGTAPSWAPFAGVEAAIRRGNHALVLHEYWALNGPGENWGWWGGRFMKCPWDVPIIIGECGVDLGVVQDPATLPGNRGWQGNVSAATFAQQCGDYMRRCQSDPRFFAGTIFETDYASGEWQSFDTEPARHELVSRASSLAPARWYAGSVPPEPEPGPTPPTPPVTTIKFQHPVNGARITQHWGQNEEAYRRFGMWGHNGVDFGAPQGTIVKCLTGGVVAYVGTDDSYGKYIRVWHEDMGVWSFYAHLHAQSVKQGDRVVAGQELGKVGSTGNSTGPHLHLEIRDSNGSGGYNDLSPMPKGRICPESWCCLHGLRL